MLKRSWHIRLREDLEISGSGKEGNFDKWCFMKAKVGEKKKDEKRQIFFDPS